jgi:hypothetical protein
MINLFSYALPCSRILLEYSEEQEIMDFDLSLPLNPGIIQTVLSPRYPELEARLTELYSTDTSSGVMLDRFHSETNQPAVITFRDPETFFATWGVEASIDESKQFYAAVVYTGRDNLVRTIYRNPELPAIKTDVHSGDGTLSHHEEIFKGELPAELAWAETRLQELKDAGVDAKINHFKNTGEKPKVYFLVEASKG